MGVPFQEFDVSRDRAAAQEMVNLTGQMGVPVTVINGEAVIGFDRARLQQLLSARSSAAPKGVRFGLKIADAQKMAGQAGAIVGDVTRGFLGEKAGLKTGDIITEVSGKRITGAADMERVLAAIKPGNIVSIMFLREGKPRKSEIVA
jgi:S1-C subfamily serine protease